MSSFAYINFDRYPVDLLPAALSGAMHAAERQVQSPIPIIGASMLSAMSVACQGLFDIKLPSGPTVPPSLFFLTVADSGERKSATDKLFSKPILDYERRHDTARQQMLRDHAAQVEVWELRRQDAETKLKRAIRRAGPTKELEGQFKRILDAKPPLPRSPRLAYSDTTVEALLYGLHSAWPQAVLISDEAANVLNGRAMQQLTTFNEFWDGKSEVRVDRRSRESFTVHDGRITLSLMTQEKPFQQFLERNAGAAWETGLLARMLIAKPTSRQGSRRYGDISTAHAEESSPLDWFYKRVEELLDASHQQHIHGTTRPTLNFTPQAQEMWVFFASYYESQIGSSGLLRDISGYISKASNNLARMAGLIHYFCGYNGPIDDISMSSAVALANWYLAQHKMLLGEADQATVQNEFANLLDQWLRDRYYRSNGTMIAFKLSELYRFGPRKIRSRDDMNLAIDTLCSRYRILDYRRAKPAFIRLNVQPGCSF